MTSQPVLCEIDVAGVSELINERDDIVFVDVRETEEFVGGHIPSAISAPLGTLEHATDDDSIARNEALLQAKSATVVVYCDVGRRNRVAAQRLIKLGFSQVYWLSEGLNGWQSNGLPLLRKEARKPR
jgi:rhodanese-related sulfurtransferase